MMIRLFFNPKEGKYYSDEPYTCTNCHDDIEGYMLLAVFWNEKDKHTKSWIGNYCRDCFAKIKGSSMVNEYRMVRLAAIPKDSYPVLLRPPNLVTSCDISVFDAAMIGTDNVEDKTVYAGRESFEGAKIGADVWDRVSELDSKKRLNPDIYLEGLKDAERVIDHNNKPLLSKQ